MGNPQPFDQEIEAQARAWLVRMRSGHATAEDAQAFRSWCAAHPEHARMASAIGDTWNALQAAGAEVRARRAAASGATRASSRATVRGGRRAFVGFAVAAGASWLALRPPLGMWPALGDLMADYHTGTGEQREVVLENRVIVQMNTQTRINLVSDRIDGHAQRSVRLLSGEAEIIAEGADAARASRSASVTVLAGPARLRAAVARFDVRHTGEEVCVTCIAGTVSVEHPRRSVTLSEGQQLTYGDRALHLDTRVDTSTVTAWRQRMLVFRAVPLAQVVDEINRYRPGKIVLRNADLGTRLVQASFSIDTLNDAGAMIARISGARVTNLPGNIVLLG
ncbi:DUF4880 domain-containing protein [Burkholderia sp. Ac-20353]|uniref:FecR family protein n=1 Tax=Burkholderia sp. Ac-20353 TaxID=2703894 RepID=UPI00197C51E3|nr:DUF4880 domain-containing protein [Burkholderia sp. Ac-20353]MBN3789238.1 DUF4880 domain-containing protein [Burkholderia sp. Ac-20353]